MVERVNHKSRKRLREWKVRVVRDREKWTNRLEAAEESELGRVGRGRGEWTGAGRVERGRGGWTVESRKR